ncbi:MAG: hypothetical protein KDM63_06155 [Verrucomicrobiae bacterium]|nr:hypothetical protein [Verrucomicrobiae bacterium]MCB1092140.1 hypothetical protein [Verrucomicrobiae bacterium]
MNQLNFPSPARLFLSQFVWITLGISSIPKEVSAETWTNRQGVTMEATLTGYRLETKSVLFQKEDQIAYDYPLANLAFDSQWEAIGSPAFQQSISADPLFKTVLKRLFIGFVALSLIMSIVVGLPAWWATGTIVTNDNDFAHNFRGWLKIATIRVPFSIVSTYLLGLSLGSNPAVAGSANLLRLSMGLGWIVAWFWIVMRHYDIRFLRSLGFLFVNGLIGGLISGLIFGGIALTISMGGLEAMDSFVNQWILKPLGLI